MTEAVPSSRSLKFNHFDALMAVAVLFGFRRKSMQKLESRIQDLNTVYGLPTVVLGLGSGIQVVLTEQTKFGCMSVVFCHGLIVFFVALWFL